MTTVLDTYNPLYAVNRPIVGDGIVRWRELIGGGRSPVLSAD